MKGWVKALLIAIPVWLVIIIGLGMLTDQGGSVPEKIERECKRSYGSQGEQAVMNCRVEMTVRYGTDHANSKADSTYSRIR